MTLLKDMIDRIRRTRRHETRREETSDQPLNTRDYARNLNRQLRNLNMEQVFAITPLILLGAGFGLILMRRYKLASIALAGFLAEETLIGNRAAKPVHPPQPEDMDLERYAVRAERGDFGKLNVIPFR